MPSCSNYCLALSGGAALPSLQVFAPDKQLLMSPPSSPGMAKLGGSGSGHPHSAVGGFAQGIWDPRGMEQITTARKGLRET